MSTQLIISPPATGKTSKVIKSLRATLHEQPMAQVWVVVPGRLHAAAFQRQVAAGGGALGTHIGTFLDIYTEILDLAGKPFPTASATITHQLIQETVKFLASNGKIPHLDPISMTPGFLQILRERFAELKRALILPEELLSIIDRDKHTLLELSYIYNEYQNKLEELDWADPGGLSWLALETLENDQSRLADWDLLIVDGFDAFTKGQIKTLQLLAPRVSQLIVTLPGDHNMTRTVHRRFVRTLDSLTRELEFDIEYDESPPYLPQPLAHLEQNLFEPQPYKYTPTTEISAQQFPGISMVEASSPAEETREAFRWIKSLIFRYNLSPNDCAIFTADIDTYRSHLYEVATEFGLPISTSWGEPLTENPAITAISNLLDLPIRDYPYRITIDTIRSPYFDLGCFNLTPKDAHALELVSRVRQIVGGQKNWIQALDYQANLTFPQTTDHDQSNLIQDEFVPINTPSGERARQLHINLENMFNELTPPTRQSLRKWVRYLIQLLEKLEFFSHCEELIGEELISILNDLLVSESLIGVQELNYQSFISTLHGALEAGIVSHRTDPSDASIFLGQIIEARGLRYKAVALLGLAESLFPATERADPFFDEKLRAKIGLEPNIGRHQSGLFYQAVTRADQYLYLSRPYLAKDGEPWEPSYYWTLVRNIFPDSVSRISSEGDRSLSNAASRQEALFWAVRQGESPKRDPELIKRDQRVNLGRQVLQSRLVSRPQSSHEGDLGDLSKFLAHDYGNQHIWSASRFESYNSCPYLFFVTNVMAFEVVKPPELGFDPAQRGSMYHAILEETFKQAKDPGDAEAVIATLQQVASDEFIRAPEHYGFKPGALWEAEKDEMLARLEKTIEELIDRSQGWKPYKFEQLFGKRGIPALELETASGTVRISGFIDRIDRQANNLRIIDYKTGSSDLPKRDLLAGSLLQLPVYGLAAQKALDLGTTTHGFYWRINAAEPSSFKLEGFEHQGMEGPQAAYEVAVESIKIIVQGVKNGEFPPQPTKGECPTYCPAASWCWRYKPARF